MDFKKKQKGKFSFNDFLFRFGAVAFIVVFAALLYADFKIYQKKQELTNQIKTYKEQIANLEERRETLKDEIANSDNPNYIEKIAREEVDMQKPGEKVVSFVMPEQEQPIAEVAEPFFDIKNWLGWISKPWNWITSKF